MSSDDNSHSAPPVEDHPVPKNGMAGDGPRDRKRTKILLTVLILVGLVAAYGALSWSGALDEMMNSETLRKHVENLGLFGPLGVVILMSLAIVLNPIPSAPIALAAGAAYGHFWGTVYVAIGAEIGALIAFGGGSRSQQWPASFRQVSCSPISVEKWHPSIVRGL